MLESDYITTARSKGISERRVVIRHAVRNGIISMVTVLGLNIAYLVGGTLVVEKVFALPGIGGLMIDSILQRDFTVVQGITLVFAILVVLINLITDIVLLAARSAREVRLSGRPRRRRRRAAPAIPSSGRAGSATAGTARRRSSPAW